MLRGKGRFVAIAATAWAMSILSCASVLGIEEIHPDIDGGPSGSGGNAGASSSGSAGDAGTSAGGSGGSGGGATGGAAGTSSGSGGSASTTGGSGGTGGSGIADGGGAITVHGNVIDYWLHRVPDVVVYLGNATTTTDATGQFTFSNVTPPYDIGLVVHEGEIQFGGTAAAWLFKGLTRTDPTLQVIDGLVPSSSTGNAWTFRNFPAPGTNDAGPIPRFVGIAFGSPDTFWNYTYSDPDGTELGPGYIDFEGATSSAGFARALLWEAPTSDQVSPSRYVAFNEQPLTIDTFTAKTVLFDMAPGTLASAQVSGTITAYRPDPHLDGYVRFYDGSAIHVVSISTSPGSFQMLMPAAIASASITVAAFAGNMPDGPFTVAHLDGLAPGQGSVHLDVQASVTPVAPAAGATNVAANATFQWTASPHVALLSVYCKGPLSTDGYTTFNVVTQDFKTQLPSLGGASGIPWVKNQDCDWWVQIHGAYLTVDDAAGSAGYLDPFSFFYYGELWGPKRDNSGFTMSETWILHAAP